MSESADVFPNGTAAIRDWAEKSARTGWHHAIDPELVMSLVHDIDALESRVQDLLAVVAFYGDEQNWSTMAPNEFRDRYGLPPLSELKFGRMRLVAPGRALPRVLNDLGEKARQCLADDVPAQSANPEEGAAA